MVTVILSIFWGIVVLGVLVTIHEFGHFLVAKLCGVKVLKFSIGFGKKLFGFTWGETEYLVSMVPLGGYVKMLGEEDFTDEFEGGKGKGELLAREDIPPEDYERSFMAQSVFKRILIAAAGPAFNIILAFLLIWGMFMVSAEAEVFRVGYVVPGSPAYKAGFMDGDIVSSVGGRAVMSWDEVAQYAAENAGVSKEFGVSREGSELTLNAVLLQDLGRNGMGLLATIYIGPMFAHSPADKAGLVEGDRIVSLGGVHVDSPDEFIEAIKRNTNNEMSITVDRDGELLTMSITPEPREEERGFGGFVDDTTESLGLGADEPVADDPKDLPGMIGVMLMPHTAMTKLGPLEAMGVSYHKTGQMATTILDIVGKLVSGKQDPRALGGPATIAHMSGKMAQKGMRDLVFFVALLSVNLGIINLIPIPILDGGMIFFLLIEGVMGRPLDMKKREFIQMVGLILIVMLFILVFYVDAVRFLGDGGGAPMLK
jgi:regulator of sigma E protease